MPVAIRERILDALYPPTCIGCEENGSWLCDHCFGSIGFGEAFSLKPFEHAWTLSPYSDAKIQRLIKLYKYRAAFCLDDIFRRLLSRMSIDVNQIDAITWVPGDMDRIRERGMDHGRRMAGLTAKALGNHLQAEPLLLRTASALPNAGLPDNAARKGNVKHVFSCIKPLQRKRILLVDDVCTTGATAQACANTLLIAGAESLNLLVFARG